MHTHIHREEGSYKEAYVWWPPLVGNLLVVDETASTQGHLFALLIPTIIFEKRSKKYMSGEEKTGATT